MKINVNVEFDSDKKEDLELIEDALYYLQEIKEILEQPKQNLNKRTNTKKKVVQ
jgi:hypothetical protein